MAAILVFQNSETAAMLVSQTNPLGVELFSYANAFFCSNKQVSENTLLFLNGFLFSEEKSSAAKSIYYYLAHSSGKTCITLQLQLE